jgi:hypothetical protein
MSIHAMTADGVDWFRNGVVPPSLRDLGTKTKSSRMDKCSDESWIDSEMAFLLSTCLLTKGHPLGGGRHHAEQHTGDSKYADGDRWSKDLLWTTVVMWTTVVAVRMQT